MCEATAFGATVGFPLLSFRRREHAIAITVSVHCCLRAPSRLFKSFACVTPGKDKFLSIVSGNGLLDRAYYQVG